MKQCAFLTLDQRGDFVIDDAYAMAPLAALGWQTSVVCWRQTAVPWSDYAAVIIRSTWDYWNDVDGFMDVLANIDTLTRLANPLDLVRWNLAKTYLRDLECQEVGIVPTLWAGKLDAASIPGYFNQLEVDEIVLKPVIGANGVDTFRLARAHTESDLAAITPLFQKRPLMVQAFMPAILSEGEYSLFFFNGVFSHAIRKKPAAGEFRSQEERGAEIRPIKPEQKLLQRGQHALETIKPAPLYARIDLVRDQAGDFVVMELELIEPSLYLRTDPGAPARFARAVADWFSASMRDHP